LHLAEAVTRAFLDREEESASEARGELEPRVRMLEPSNVYFELLGLEPGLDSLLTPDIVLALEDARESLAAFAPKAGASVAAGRGDRRSSHGVSVTR
jgi:hypothetical protein